MTLEDVLSKAKARGDGAADKADPVKAELNWDAINAKMKGVIDLKVNMATLHALDTPGAPSAGAGDAVVPKGTGELAQLVKALNEAFAGRSGGDPIKAVTDVLGYVQSRDTDALRTEVTEIRRALTTGPQGNPALDSLKVMNELGLLERPKANDALETIKLVKEIMPPAQQQQQGGLVEQITALLALLDKISARNQPAGQQSSVIQFSDGGRLTLSDYLHLEDLKDKRDQRRIEADLSKERMASGRSLVEQLGKAVALAAEKLSGKGRAGAAPSVSSTSAKALPKRRAEVNRPEASESPAVEEEEEAGEAAKVGDVQQQGEVQPTETACDFCSSPVTINVAGQPESFECPECGKINKITYS